MILLQAAAAYMAACQMMNTEMEYQTAYAVATLKRRLQPHAAFFIEEERKLAMKHGKKSEGGKVAVDEAGNFEFASAEDAEAFAEAKRALGRIEVQEQIGILTAPRPARIRPAQLEALRGFIIFEEG